MRFVPAQVSIKAASEASEEVLHLKARSQNPADKGTEILLHRPKLIAAPPDLDNDYFGPRYSIAFLDQPCVDCEIQGPKKKYPKVYGEEFTRAAMERRGTSRR